MRNYQSICFYIIYNAYLNTEIKYHLLHEYLCSFINTNLSGITKLRPCNHKSNYEYDYNIEVINSSNRL